MEEKFNRTEKQKIVEEYIVQNQEEFEAKGIKVDISYELKCESDRYLSLVITANENWCSAYGVQYFYNIDLKEQRNLTLRDVLGDEWIDIATKQISSVDGNQYVTDEKETGTADTLEAEQDNNSEDEIESKEETLEEVPDEKKLGKIYLMLGMNELGYDFNATVKRYSELVDWLQTKEPDAIIYL